MNKKRWIANFVEIILGTILVICGAAGMIDAFWSGMGGALIGIGVLYLIRGIRYRSNPEFKEQYDIELHDERNSFLRLKAWSWAGYLFVMIAAVGTIAFKLAGREDLMMLCSGCVCLVLVLYWLSYMVLKKKY